MTRTVPTCLAVVALCIHAAVAMAQPSPSEAPEPKMPAMPSMEGQQGDVSKPVTQIPPRRKAAAETAGVKMAGPKTSVPKTNGPKASGPKTSSSGASRPASAGAGQAGHRGRGAVKPRPHAAGRRRR